MAEFLCVHAGLVRSAVDRLVAFGLVEVDQDEQVVATSRGAAPEEAGRIYRGHVAWDPSADRPATQIWLDEQLPHSPPGPDGWEMLPFPDAFDRPGPPAPVGLDHWLRLLPHIRGLRVLEPFGSGVRELDSASIARIRPRTSASSQTHWLWVPVEARPLGPAVWRPSLVPTARVKTELAPAAWESLMRNAAPETRKELEAQQDRYRDAVMPGVLKSAGFASVGEFRRTMASAARQMLGDATPSDKVRAAMEDAVAVQTLAETIGADWRMLAKPWSALLDVVVLEAADLMRPGFDALPLRAVSDDEADHVRALLGDSLHHLRKAMGSSGETKQLRKDVANCTDTLGVRMLLFGARTVFDPAWRRRWQEVDRTYSGIFGLLNDTVQDRNRVEHEKGDALVVDVEAFRARVVRITRALSRL
jgi:hypothetical protein